MKGRRHTLSLTHGHHYRLVTSSGRVHPVSTWDAARMAFVVTPSAPKLPIVLGLDLVERVAPVTVDRRTGPVADLEAEVDIRDVFLEPVAAAAMAVTT